MPGLLYNKGVFCFVFKKVIGFSFTMNAHRTPDDQFMIGDVCSELSSKLYFCLLTQNGKINSPITVTEIVFSLSLSVHCRIMWLSLDQLFLSDINAGRYTELTNGDVSN